MRAAACALTFLLGCSGAQTVCPVPEACPACAANQTAPDAGVLPSGNILGERWGELNPVVETHMTLISGNLEPHLRGGGGFEVAKGFTRANRVRFIKSTTFTGGAWGDQQHGQFNIESGFGIRGSFYGDLTLIDLYLQGTEGIIVGIGGGPSPEWGNVAGLGIGLRLFRAFSVEFTGRAIYAFGSAFKATDGTTARVLPEFGLALRFDFCSIGNCNYDPIQQKTDDVTCAIYTDAQGVCMTAQKAGGSARADLCKNALKAMSMKDSGDPILAREAVPRFLADLAAGESGTPRAPSENDLVKTNSCLMDWRSCGRKQECLMAQQGQKPNSRRMYSPYVLELLAALGCDAEGRPRHADCDYRCEVPMAKPPACAGP